MKCVIQVMGMRSTKYGGLERYMCALANELQLRNYKLIIIYESKPSSEKYVADLIKYNAEIRVIPSRGLSIFKFIVQFSFLLMKVKPLIVHCHFDPAGHIALLISWGFRVKKRFRTIHSMLSNDMHKEVIQLNELGCKTILLRYLMRKLSTRILCVSEGIKNQFCNLFGLDDKIQTLYLGVEMNYFDRIKSRKKYQFPEGCLIIACVAFHDDIKGIDILIRAISILKSSFNLNNFLLFQIGGGYSEKTKELKKIAEKFNISEKIIWMGQQDNVPDILAAADIYCQPSRSEGIPLTIMEASMASLPIVATSVGGIPEAVEENSSGFIVPSEDEMALAEKLHLLIEDTNLRIIMGQRAKQFAQNNFSIHHQSERLIDLYLLD